MVEKFKKYLVKSFSNGPKAKIILGVIAALCCIAVGVISMRKTVKVNFDGIEKTFVTYKGTVGGALQQQGIEVSNKDKVHPSLEAKISKDDTISVKKAVQVKVVISGEERIISTAEDTIGDMLLAEADNFKEEGIEYKDSDIVKPQKDTAITSDMDIQVVKVQEEEVQEIEEIPFETELTID